MQGLLYDRIYGFKNYAAEAQQVTQEIRRLNPQARTLLDVACGTGGHLAYLSQSFVAQGLDLDPQQVAEARQKHPHLLVHLGDMQHFALGQTFDALTCLFGSIGYLDGPAELQQALHCFAAHLNPGGVLLLEPWIFPQDFVDGRFTLHTSQDPKHSLARIIHARRQGNYSWLHMHFLLGQDQGVRYFSQDHRLYLFADEDYASAVNQAGMVLRGRGVGLARGGVYLAQKPNP